jgi:membrane-associated phospholipid phosphatase
VVALALLVGIGRVYERAHYPSDVLTGLALGGVWASVCLTAAEVFGRLYEKGSTRDAGSGVVRSSAGQPSGSRQEAEPSRWRRPGTFEYGARGSVRRPTLGGG